MRLLGLLHTLLGLLQYFEIPLFWSVGMSVAGLRGPGCYIMLWQRRCGPGRTPIPTMRRTWAPKLLAQAAARLEQLLLAHVEARSTKTGRLAASLRRAMLVPCRRFPSQPLRRRGGAADSSTSTSEALRSRLHGV